MANELTIAKSGGAGPAKALADVKVNNDAIDAGIGAGFARITYKGAKWGIKYQGETKMLRRTNDKGHDDGPSPYLDVVILDAAEHSAKAWYEGKYQEGDTMPPDCASSNGVTPDFGVPKPQSQLCYDCPRNAWGSAIGPDNTPSKGKACADHKSLVVVPVGDIENKAYGGPMLLSVPPTSLKRLGPFKRNLSLIGYRTIEVWTRLAFDEKSAFPLFEFDAIRALSENEGAEVAHVMLTQRETIDRIKSGNANDAPRPLSLAAPATTPVTPVTPTKTQASPEPDLTIPAHLNRAAPALTPEQAKIKELEAALAAAKAPPPPPEPELTPEQKKIKELEAALAAAKAGPATAAKPARGRSARTPAVSPEPTDSAAEMAAQKPSGPVPTAGPTPTPITASGNGSVDADVGAKIGDMVKNLL